jgi:hypothetical protein
MMARSLRRLSTSCAAAVRIKPKVRPCEGSHIVDESDQIDLPIALSHWERVG